MIADPLTKSGNDKFIQPMETVISSGKIDFTASAESTLRKMKSQKARLAKVMQKNSKHDENFDEAEIYEES